MDKNGKEQRLDDYDSHECWRKIYSLKKGYHGHIRALNEKRLPNGKLDTKNIPSTMGSMRFDSGLAYKITPEYDEFKIPKGQYFMMGDNSNNSLDSRYWGPVPRKNIIGTAMGVFWPFSHRWGVADKIDINDKSPATKKPGKY